VAVTRSSLWGEGQGRDWDPRPKPLGDTYALILRAALVKSVLATPI